VVLPGDVDERASLLIQDGRIGDLVESTSPNSPAPDSQIDLRGLTIFPGFIDIHIHGAIGVDTMDATAADLLRVSQFLATRGVAGWLPTLVPAPDADYARAIDAIAAAIEAQRAAGGPSQGARILGVHYEGPFVNSTQCGALHTDFFRSFSGASDLDSLPTLDDQRAIHLITLAPEIDGGVELVAELHRRGWIVSLGHTRADVARLDQVFAAGARHLTHFMNAMAPLHHRAPGPVAWGLMRDDVTCDLIADGIHLDRDTLRLLLKLKGAQGLSLISDAVAAAGMGDGAYEIWGETITVKDGRTSNAHGTIAGSVITMLEAVRLMLSVGASEVEVARMGATNPARLLGIDQDCGSIEAGKRADLVAVDAEGNVRLTLIGGEIVFDAR
jgi:N-acetylglucosamine-6-phosphate deacetylase